MAFCAVAFSTGIATGEPRVPSVGFQPHSPIIIKRCAAEIRIDRNGGRKTIAYRHAIQVVNVSGRAVKRIDFAVVGLDDRSSPVSAITVTTRWKKPFQGGTSSYSSYAESGTIPRYYRITPSDLVQHLQCAITRVFFVANGQWKDTDVIRLAENASPDVCVYDVPDGVVAESCNEPSRLTPQDMATASRLQTVAQRSRMKPVAAARITGPRSALVQTRPTPPVERFTHKNVRAPSGSMLSLAVLMGSDISDTDVAQVGITGDDDGALIVFGIDAMHRIVCGPRGAAIDVVFVAADGTITGVASLVPGAPNMERSHINGFGAHAIALRAGMAAREGLVTGSRLSDFP